MYLNIKVVFDSESVREVVKPKRRKKIDKTVDERAGF
jgi:hypothetical protein